MTMVGSGELYTYANREDGNNITACRLFSIEILGVVNT